MFVRCILSKMRSATRGVNERPPQKAGLRVVSGGGSILDLNRISLMKHFKRSIILFVAVVSPLSAQTAMRSHIYAKWGRFVSFGAGLFEHHDLKIMDVHLPFSMGLGLSVLQPHHPGMFYHIELDVLSRADNDTKVRQIPLSLGARHFFCHQSSNIFHFYVGGDVLLCWSALSPVAPLAKMPDDWIFGYGIGADCGVVCDIGSALFVGLDIKSNYIVSSGSGSVLENIRGVDVSLRIGIKLDGLQIPI